MEKPSKACRTCHARRVRCDNTRPVCLNCSSRNRECGGYEDKTYDIFINLDQGSISSSKKQLLNKARKERAAREATRERSQPGASRDLVLGAECSRALSCSQKSDRSALSAPLFRELSDRNFPGQAKCLWHGLSTEYSMTDDIWTLGVPSLMFQNRTFDLTVIALCMQRLSVRENDSRYQSMSLDAYSTALQSHRDRLNSHRPSAILATTSALLTLLEGAQPNGSHVTYRAGHEGHFMGTIALMKACGPEPFHAPGYHEIFKKVREMAPLPDVETEALKVYRALAARERIFFSSRGWRTVPWMIRSKTWRDQLLDIALDMTEGNDFNLLEERLLSLHKAWLMQCYHLKHVCSQSCPKHCFRSLRPADFPTVEFTLLQAELWAIALVLLVRRRISLTSITQTFEDREAPELWDFCTSCHRLALDLASALSLPCFGQGPPGEQKARGISEGRSRSLFCFWALDTYHAGGDPLEEVFWGKLGTRLNGAISETDVPNAESLPGSSIPEL